MKKERKAATKNNPLYNTYGQVQTGRALRVLSEPGVQIASVPQGFGLQIEPRQ